MRTPGLKTTRLFAASAIGMCLAVSAPADSVKIGGFWIDNVAVDKIAEGKLLYISPTGSDAERSIADLEGIKLDDYPALGEGIDAFTKNDYEESVTKLVTVRANAKKEAWLRDYVDWFLFRAYDKLNDGPNALKHYLALVSANAEPIYLQMPPVNSVAGISTKDRADAISTIERASNRSKSKRAQESLGRLVDVLKAGQPPQALPAEAKGRGAVGAGTLRPPTSEGQPVSGDGAPIILPKNAPADRPVVALLRQGEFAQALETANKDAARPGSLSSSLFYKGLAQRAIADAATDADQATREKLYMDAGLSFMRVVIYFSRTPYAPLAMLEAGYVHEQIGDDTMADELYKEAGRSIDQETYPDYYQRYLELTRQPQSTE